MVAIIHDWPLEYVQFPELKPCHFPWEDGVHHLSSGNHHLWNFLNEEEVAEATSHHFLSVTLAEGW